MKMVYHFCPICGGDAHYFFHVMGLVCTNCDQFTSERTFCRWPRPVPPKRGRTERDLANQRFLSILMIAAGVVLWTASVIMMGVYP